MRFVGVDPATETGVVALDENGNPVLEISIIGKGEKKKGGITPEQRMSLENQLYQLLLPGDVILKEGVANGNQKLITTAKIHGGLEGMITRKGLRFEEIAPDSVKKFVGVTGWVGEVGSKRRLVDDEKKKAMAEGALEHFNYYHPNDNVVDAFIIAKICEALYKVRQGKPLTDFPEHQKEVINSIINPPPPKKKPKKKKTEKTNQRRGKPRTADSHAQNTEQTCLF